MANWKMNLAVEESASLAGQLAKSARELTRAADVVLCPSFPALPRVLRQIAQTDIALGAQDVFWEDEGNFTGEVSVRQLRELHCAYVIVGHSERRRLLGETDEMIRKKTSAVIRNNVTPILCVGESNDERRSGRQELVVASQVKEALANIRPPFLAQRIVIAYEPMWAIASGEACDPAEAKRMGEVITYALLELYDSPLVRDNFRITYGGSVTADNIKEYVDFDPLEGVLVGGASLNAESFLGMARAVIPSAPPKKTQPQRARRAKKKR